MWSMAVDTRYSSLGGEQGVVRVFVENGRDGASQEDAMGTD